MAIRVGIIMITVMLLIALSFIIGTYAQVSQARHELKLEINEYYRSAAQRAGSLAYDLAQPFLSERDRGRFEERIRRLDEGGPALPFLVPTDSYSSIMWDLCYRELPLWAMRELDEQGEDPNNLERRKDLMKKTPQASINDLREVVETIGMIGYELTHEETKAKSLTEVQAARDKFIEAQLRLENLISRR